MTQEVLGMTQEVPRCDSEVQAGACRSLGISIVCFSSHLSDSISKQSVTSVNDHYITCAHFQH